MNTVILAEAWGKEEEAFQHALVGASGQELWRMLRDAGFNCAYLPYNFVSPFSMIKRWKTLGIPLLNVFNARPQDNNVEAFYGRANQDVDKTLPVRKVGSANLYVLAEHAHHVRTLHETLARIKPNLIIALGNSALWGLGLPPAISTLRGNVIETTIIPGLRIKTLPTWHPAAVLRNWPLRLQAVVDLLKARRESEFPEIRVKERFIWTEPSIADLYSWWDQHGKSAPLLSFDIETTRNTQITEIAFAAGPTQALHVPFLLDEKGKVTSYWPTLEEEFQAWKFVKMVLGSEVPKVGHNACSYDLYWLTQVMHMPVKNFTHDTLVLSHAWQPELPKRLGFLGSVFLDTYAWKHLRRDSAKEAE
jgi:uracil-DNA glycosylase family 4